MFSQEIALTILTNLPLTTQLSMLETAFKVAVFTGRISMNLFRKLKGTPPQPPVIIEVTEVKESDENYIMLSKY